MWFFVWRQFWASFWGKIDLFDLPVTASCAIMEYLNRKRMMLKSEFSDVLLKG